MFKTNIALAFVCLALSSSAFADKPEGSVYLDGGDSKNGIVLAHGKGKHPTWLVVDQLRNGINAKLGYHTISLQMPTGYSDWQDYADGFPDWNNMGSSMSSDQNLAGINLPVLDIWVGNNGKDSKAASVRKGMASESKLSAHNALHRYVHVN